LKQKLKIAAWALFAVLVLVVLFLARRKQEDTLIQKPVVAISVVDENAFLTETELVNRLERLHLYYANQKSKDLNTTAIEEHIRKMHEVDEVQVYKQLGGNWGIRVKIRQPYARVFNRSGESFYVDSDGESMATSPNFTARVVVFTGYINDKCDSISVQEINANPSLRSDRCLDEIYRISKVIHEDEFLNAQITQVHRDKWGDFILIPRVGSNRIVLGPAGTDQEVREKLKKLKIFYQNGLPYVGWNTYGTINLKYRNQVVCTRIDYTPVEMPTETH
jgi:cell division protein FtsQ